MNVCPIATSQPLSIPFHKTLSSKKGWVTSMRTYSNLPSTPPPLNNPAMINEQRGEQGLRRVCEPGNLPYQAAPELPVWKEMGGDVNGGEMFDVEDGECD